MENRYKKISIDEIPAGSYQGYYWLSNLTKPEVQQEGEINKSIFGSIPFVVEANYYSKENDISIQVKNVDGEYMVTMIDLKGLEGVEYIGHDVDDNYLVVEAWSDFEDDFLEGMKTKVPSWSAFKGFIKPKNTAK